MLQIKIIIGLATLIISHLHLACSPAKRVGNKSIIDVRNTIEPDVKLISHRPYDVEVYRIIFMGEMYKVRYYRKESNKLVSYAASYGTQEDFNKVGYEWLTDTSVTIRLYNNVTNKERRFEVYGKGSSSGMRFDK